MSASRKSGGDSRRKTTGKNDTAPVEKKFFKSSAEALAHLQFEVAPELARKLKEKLHVKDIILPPDSAVSPVIACPHCTCRINISTAKPDEHFALVDEAKGIYRCRKCNGLVKFLPP